MDVADRDTHTESHHEGFVKVEGNIMTFFENSRAYTRNYDPMTEVAMEEAKAIPQRFLLLDDGNIALLRRGSDSEILEEVMGYGSRSVGKAILEKQ
eukprot:CAMPEP_0181313866 /NCGR_PEP_ID=MMETSP1101-20121128/14490_1 /TAXON_ID=46948 /ORGANISM="Rhodomonas abbreviata, Strain Caron Lab Isolate" /LENGTH=95 /DNA_ID=CAMNT_0023420875 /DNA_START=277 /DNA_END=564 /DNA_ORIENTATION=+